MSDRVEIAAGQVWAMPCPFFVLAQGDREQWCPGDSGEDTPSMGLEIREVIHTVDLPAPYRCRVFYKRKWRDPDGREFGRGHLRCISVPAFQSWRRNGLEWNPQWANGGATLIEEKED